MQVFEDDEERGRGGFGAHEREPGAEELVAEEARVGSGGARAAAGDLAEQVGDAHLLHAAEAAAHPAEDLDLAHRRGLPAVHGGGAPEGRSDHPEGRAGAHQVGAAHPYLRLRPALAHLTQKLLAEPRLARAGRRGDEHGLGHGLGDALLEERGEARELGVAADAHRGLAEQEALRVRRVALGGEPAAARVAAHVAPRAHEAADHVVDAHLLAAATIEHGDAAVDGLAHRHRAGDHGAPGDQRERHARQERPHGERAARRLDRLVRTGARAAQRDEERSVDEDVQPAAIALREGAQGVLALLGVCRGGVARGGVARVARVTPEHCALGRRGGAGDEHAEQALLDGGHARAGRGRVAALARDLAEAAQLVGHRAPVRRPIGGRLGQHPGDEIVEALRDVGPEIADARRLLDGHLEQRRQHVLADEGRAAREAAEEHAGEGEDVGGGADVALAARLLGGHVAGRADHVPGVRERPLGAGDAGDAEVEELGALGRAVDEEDVARLDVAVHHAAPVRLVERRGDAHGERDALVERQLLALEAVGEVFALEPFHGQVERALVRAAVGDVADDRGVVQVGQDEALALEARGLDALGLQDLDGDARARDQIARAVDLAHPTRAGDLLGHEAARDELVLLHRAPVSSPGIRASMAADTRATRLDAAIRERLEAEKRSPAGACVPARVPAPSRTEDDRRPRTLSIMRISRPRALGIATLCAAGALTACGARSTLEGEPASTGTGAGVTGTGAGPTTPPDAGVVCPDAMPKAYLCDTGNTIYAFDPPTLVAEAIGTFDCPEDTIPWTMTVDGAGAAYLIYDDWNVYKVDLTSFECTQTPYAPGQLGFTGEEGIAVAPVNGVPRFFVYGANPSPTLAVGDLTSFVLSSVGAVTPATGEFPVAIQGDAFGRLYAFSQDSTFFEMGATTADVTHLDHTALPGGGNWAVLAYGTQIYLFGSGGAVGLYDPAAEQLTTVGSVGFSIIGASATPCIP